MFSCVFVFQYNQIIKKNSKTKKKLERNKIILLILCIKSVFVVEFACECIYINECELQTEMPLTNQKRAC